MNNYIMYGIIIFLIICIVLLYYKIKVLERQIIALVIAGTLGIIIMERNLSYDMVKEITKYMLHLSNIDTSDRTLKGVVDSYNNLKETAVNIKHVFKIN